jgi:hypothetical protein
MLGKRIASRLLGQAESRGGRFYGREYSDDRGNGRTTRAGRSRGRGVAARIVLANRSTPPDTIVARVEELTGGERFDDIDTVIARDALAAISERYKQLTSGDIQSVNR